MSRNTIVAESKTTTIIDNLDRRLEPHLDRQYAEKQLVCSRNCPRPERSN